MNKPYNKKKCSGCNYFLKMRYPVENGKNASICFMDFRVDDCGGGCKFWTGRKYTKDDRRNLKINMAVTYGI